MPSVWQDTQRFYEALCLWREARGASRPAKAAILAVIRNRAEDKKARWPKTPLEVILQPRQFSSFNSNDPNAMKLPDPKSKPDWAAWQECVMVVDTALEADPTDGANHYESCAPGQLPAWAKADAITVEIGPFRFYKL